MRESARETKMGVERKNRKRGRYREELRVT